MTDWSQLEHAYGTAEDIPGLLDRVEPDLRSRTWTEVWSRLCHQGTVYSASFAALPALAQKARDWSPADRVMPLILAGAIVGSTHQAHGHVNAHRDYEAQIADMIGLTSEALQDPSVEETNYIYLLQALAEFEAIEVWNHYLEYLVDGEFEAFCPDCEAENTIVIGEEGYFVAGDPDEDARPQPLLPASVDALAGAARRLHTRALTDGHPLIAEKLTYLFGTAGCAYCETTFQLGRAVANP
jgi:hypothetical protein